MYCSHLTLAFPVLEPLCYVTVLNFVEIICLHLLMQELIWFPVDLRGAVTIERALHT